MRRIDAGALGVCSGCEENINPKGPGFNPGASFFIRCRRLRIVSSKVPEARSKHPSSWLPEGAQTVSSRATGAIQVKLFDKPRRICRSNLETGTSVTRLFQSSLGVKWIKPL